LTNTHTHAYTHIFYPSWQICHTRAHTHTNYANQDYRSVEINYLRAAGKTEEEISKLIPKTPAEVAEERRSKLTEVGQLKKDVEELKKEVKELREKVFPDEKKEGEKVDEEKKEAEDTAAISADVDAKEKMAR